jgi:hypothetical protein
MIESRDLLNDRTDRSRTEIREGNRGRSEFAADG